MFFTFSMIKTANTKFPVIDLIRERWSTRTFSDKKLTDEHLLTLIEAASWAPSSMNEQPWRYRYGLQGSDDFQQIWECLNKGNQLWSDRAGTMILCTAKKNLSRNGEPNHYAWHDTGMANAFLLLQATQMGIYGHIMAGFDEEKVKAAFPLAEDEEPVCIIALGFLGDPEQLNEPFRTREITPRTRRPLEELILNHSEVPG